MAKEKAELPAEAVQVSALPKPAQAAVANIVGDMGTSVKKNLKNAAASQARQAATASAKSEAAETPEKQTEFQKKSTAYSARARRLSAAVPALKAQKLTVTDAAANRVALVEKAAKEMAPTVGSSGDVARQWKQDKKTKNIADGGKPILSGVKLPGEALAGVGFYHRTHEEALAAMSYNPEAAFAATAVASSRSRIEDESASFGEVARIHHPDSSASLYMHPAIVHHLHSNGVDVPVNQIGKHVAIRDVSAPALAALTHPDIRATAHANSNDVNFADLAKTNTKGTLEHLIHSVRGSVDADKIQNPLTAPKTWSFARNKADATPGTRDEYEARAYHLGKVIRGEIDSGQQMFDFHGLRDSNEGILSNQGHSTEDSWMHSTNYRHMMAPEYPDKKVMGELIPSVKTATVRGKDVSVYPHPDFGGQSVYHAFGNQATSTAAKMLQDKYHLGYTVPAAMVQETAWAAARRDDYKETDPAFKDAAKTMQASLRQQETEKRANARRNAKLSASLDDNISRMDKGKAPKNPSDGMLF